jgi:hypothetical protein
MATTEQGVRGEIAPDDQPRAENTIQWCHHYGVERALVPFSYRRRNVIDEFEALANAIDQLPRTAATFTMADLDSLSDREHFPRPRGAGLVETHLNLLGAWLYARRSASQRWLNPRYIHEHPFRESRFDESQRLQLCRRAARLGVLRVEDVAPAVGMQRSGLQKWLEDRSIPWVQWRRRGRMRIARTLQLIREWTDRPMAHVARLFRTVPAQTIRRWPSRYDVLEEWSVPERPGKHWTVYRGGDPRDHV